MTDWWTGKNSSKDKHNAGRVRAFMPENLRKVFPNGIKAWGIEKDKDYPHLVSFSVRYDHNGETYNPVYYIKPDYIGPNDIIKTDDFIRNAIYSDGQ